MPRERFALVTLNLESNKEVKILLIQVKVISAKNEADHIDAISRRCRRWSVTADNRVLSEEQALISEMLDAIEGYLTKGYEVSFKEKSRMVYRLVDVVREKEKAMNWQKRYMK
jgi:hypothetical protein